MSIVINLLYTVDNILLNMLNQLLLILLYDPGAETIHPSIVYTIFLFMVILVAIGELVDRTS